MTSAPQRALGTRSLPLPLLAAGTAGSALVAVGGLGAGAVPLDGGWPALLPRPLGTALVAVGVLLLVGAWWRARQALDEVTPGALVRATALWSAPLLVAPPLFSRDVYSYAGQALVVARGLDPYAVGPSAAPGDIAGNVDDVWLDTPSPYGPAFLGPASLLLRLTGDEVLPAVLLLRLLAVAGLVLTAVALPVLARVCGVAPQRALWLGLANPLGLLHGVGGMHNDALMVGLLVAGAALALGGRGLTRLPGSKRVATRPSARGLLAAGALVALAGLVKAPALGALPFLALAAPGPRTQARSAAGLAAGALATGVLVHAVTGLGLGWLGALQAGRARLSLFSPMTGLGTAVGSLAESLGVADDADAVREAVLAAGVMVALLVCGLLLLRTARRPSPRAAVQGLGLALLTVVALSPTVLPWYVLWGVVPLAAVARPHAAAALGAATALLCVTTWPSGRSVVRPPLYGLPLLAAAVAAVAAWGRGAGGAHRGADAGMSPPASN